MADVKVDLSKLKKLALAAAPRSPAMLKVKKRMARGYRSFLYKRFNSFSRGGGNWPNTKRRASGKTKFILRKTHTLFRSLSPVYRSLPGQYEKITGNKIEVGIKGGRHPEAKISVGRLAQIHHNGIGIQKQRKIIVRPPGELTNKWQADIKKTVLADARK